MLINLKFVCILTIGLLWMWCNNSQNIKIFLNCSTLSMISHSLLISLSIILNHICVQIPITALTLPEAASLKSKVLKHFLQQPSSFLMIRPMALSFYKMDHKVVNWFKIPPLALLECPLVLSSISPNNFECPGACDLTLNQSHYLH